MILVEQQHQDPIVCKDLVHAVHTLLAQNMNFAPRVSVDGKTVIETEWRYIQGDCYVPDGYVAKTKEAKWALVAGEALERVENRIRTMAWWASRELPETAYRPSEQPLAGSLLRLANRVDSRRDTFL